MSFSGSSWLKFGLFTVGLGQSFVFVLVPPLARNLGLSEIQTSMIFAISGKISAKFREIPTKFHQNLTEKY